MANNDKAFYDLDSKIFVQTSEASIINSTFSLITKKSNWIEIKN